MKKELFRAIDFDAHMLIGRTLSFYHKSHYGKDGGEVVYGIDSKDGTIFIFDIETYEAKKEKETA